jgi:hypothetical protein
MIHLLKRAALAVCALFCAAGFAPKALAQDIYSASTAPTVSSSPAYSTGDVVGGLLAFQDLGRSGGGAGMLQSVTISLKSTQTVAFDFLWCGASALPNTTLTDNGVLSVAAADFGACKAFHVTDCTSLGTPTTCSADNLAWPYKLAGGTVAYGVLVVRGAMTLQSTNDLSVSLTAFRN